MNSVLKVYFAQTKLWSVFSASSDASLKQTQVIMTLQFSLSFNVMFWWSLINQSIFRMKVSYNVSPTFCCFSPWLYTLSDHILSISLYYLLMFHSLPLVHMPLIFPSVWLLEDWAEIFYLSFFISSSFKARLSRTSIFDCFWFHMMVLLILLFFA